MNRWAGLRLAGCAAILFAGTSGWAQPAAAPAASAPEAAEVAPVSSAAQRIYEQTRGRLVQVRTLLKTQDSQSSVGSAFLVSDQGHLITNYHVVSQFALQPDRYRLVFAAADGSQGALQLLAFDVVHDLALVKPVAPSGAGALSGRGAVPFLPVGQVPPRGARMFSLGNPLDVGFAVNEGAYNGLVERSFVPTVFFGGSLSPGMSGGPALDEVGRLVGVNVATRIGGEQVSLVVPAEFAQALLARGRDAAPIIQPVYPELTRQLLAYETALTDKFIAQTWRAAGHARYKIPVPQEQFMRCWGSGSRATDKGLQFERSDCQMDTSVFISDSLQLGSLSVRHEAYDGSRIGPLRFAQRHSASFANEGFGVDNPASTAPRCHERTVDSAGLPLRAVVCLSAYKKLPGLYRLGVLVATLDQASSGAQGRFDASGVSFDNAMRLTQHYLDGFGWIKPHDRLALIDVFDRDGRLHHTQDVFAWPITLGRALHNSVVIDDPYVAPSHARLEQSDDGRLQLAIGPSLNGGRLGKRRLASGDHAELSGGATHHFQLGSTRLRLRLPDAAIAPERSLAVGARPLLTTLVLLLVLAALVAWPVWLSRDPGDDWRGWLPVIVGGPAALLVWCGAWGLASKIFQHRFEFWGHLGIAVRVLVVAELIELVLPQLAASLDLPTLWRASNWLTPLALAVLCWSHARRVMPDHARGLALLATLVWGVATAVTLTTNQQRHDRFNAEPYMSTLPLPMFRWYAAVPSSEFVEEARKLQAPLQARVKEAQDEDKGDTP